MTRRVQRRPAPKKPVPSIASKPDAAWPAWWHVALVALVAFGCFAATLGYEFVYDDHPQILGNPRIRSFSNLGRVFSENFWAFRGPGAYSNYYRPLQAVTYMLAYAVRGPSPAVFHAVNVVLHVLVSAAVLWVAWELLPPAAALGGALLFAAHPIHTESVAWVAAVTDVGAALFYFVAIAAYVRSRKSAPHAPLWLAASSLAFLCALLFKEMALTLPLVVVLLDLVVLEHRQPGAGGAGVQPRLLRWLPFAAVAGVYLALRLNALGSFSRPHLSLSLGASDRLATMLLFAGRYLQKLLVPIGQNAYYVFRPVSRLHPIEWLLPLALLAACGFLAWRALRNQKVLLWLSAWTVVTLGPVLTFENVGQNVFTERYLYIPSLGFCLLLAALCFRYLERRIAAAVVCLVVSLYSVLTVMRSPVWRENKTLFLTTLAASPDAVGLHNGLGVLYSQENNLPEARRSFERALEAESRSFVKVREDEAGSLLGLSYVARAEGRLQDALTHALDASRVLPTSDEAFEAAGLLLGRLGRVAEAEKYLRRALELNPSNTQARVNLGNVLSLRNDLASAEREFGAALRSAPDSAGARIGLAVVYQRTGRAAAAVSLLKEALALDPGRSEARRLLQQLSAGQAAR